MGAEAISSMPKLADARGDCHAPASRPGLAMTTGWECHCEEPRT